jgi:hypothetical protein
VLASTRAVSYLAPLREGGSLPGIMEADDFGTWVAKFHGAGQGPKVLVAEVVVAQLAGALDVRVPELRTIELDASFGRHEPDPEIAELLLRSEGTNLAVDFLPGAVGYEPGILDVDTDLAARILWLDAFTANVDRTWRNPNLLVWHGELWAIDHGAALWFHHAWSGAGRFAAQPFDTTGHVFADHAATAVAVDRACATALDDAALDAAVAAIPEVWLAADTAHDSPTAARRAYLDHLTQRRDRRDAWLPGADA